MARFEVKLPRMGESVTEATITSWLKNVGDRIELDEVIVEIATDKVDSEIQSEVEGTLLEQLFEVDDVIKVGETLAIIETTGEEEPVLTENDIVFVKADEVDKLEKEIEKVSDPVKLEKSSTSGKFYSPLVRNIAAAEHVSMEELDAIIGTGKDNRVTKNDILAYVAGGRSTKRPVENRKTPVQENDSGIKQHKKVEAPVSMNGEDEIIEMSRMGKLIAHHMIESVHTSAHVQSFIEVDVTNIVDWRNSIKDKFHARENEKITYTPIFMLAVAKALKAFPMINISVRGDTIIKRKSINLGMATALSDGNLIVPVIKNADLLSLVGMTKAVNDLAGRARRGELKPDDIQDGTYTVTNVGSFGSIFGTPIINQPQVGILALGTVRKVPAVIETPNGDFIGIRHKMIISHSYDHRVVNGAMGGMFIKAIKDSLEAWEVDADF